MTVAIVVYKGLKLVVYRMLTFSTKVCERDMLVNTPILEAYFIDVETLTMAVRHCLYFQIEPSFLNVKKAIRNAVLNNGKSIIDFPESWGDDLMDVSQVEVDNVLKLLKSDFSL